MKKRIIIHATDTPADLPVTQDDIMALYSEDRYSDPMPYHYIVNTDGKILKGKPDRELCVHCGRFSRDSISVAYAGGILPVEDSDTGDFCNTMNETQESALRFLIGQLHIRHPSATITGANSLLYPADDPTYNEPYFDVQQWLNHTETQKN